MLNPDVILRLIRDIEDVKLFGELYYDLSRRKIASEENIADAKLKMNFCRDKVIAVSHYVDEQLRELHAKPISAGSTMDALGRLGEQTRILEGAAMKKIALDGKMESLFEEYRKGRFTFFQYTEMKMRILHGKTQEQWEDLLEGTMYDSLAKIKPLNKLIFNALYSEDRHDLLRIEVEPVPIPENEIESAPVLVAPSPDVADLPKKETAKPRLELPVPSPPEIAYVSEQKPAQLPAVGERPIEELMKEAKALISEKSAKPVPAPPAPKYHEEEERAVVEKLHEVAATNPRHGEHYDPTRFNPKAIAEAQKKAEAEKEEARKETPKIAIPEIPNPVEERIKAPTGELAAPLDDDDPYVKWLVQSGREEEEDRIGRLIKELKSQPIETEAKIKVVQELTTKLEKMKEKKEESKPLDPRMLEESVEEYEF